MHTFLTPPFRVGISELREIGFSPDLTKDHSIRISMHILVAAQAMYQQTTTIVAIMAGNKFYTRQNVRFFLQFFTFSPLEHRLKKGISLTDVSLHNFKIQ